MKAWQPVSDEIRPSIVTPCTAGTGRSMCRRSTRTGTIGTRRSRTGPQIGTGRGPRARGLSRLGTLLTPATLALPAAFSLDGSLADRSGRPAAG
jgi:hypothetical protein